METYVDVPAELTASRMLPTKTSFDAMDLDPPICSLASKKITVLSPDILNIEADYELDDHEDQSEALKTAAAVAALARIQVGVPDWRNIAVCASKGDREIMLIAPSKGKTKENSEDRSTEGHSEALLIKDPDADLSRFIYSDRKPCKRKDCKDCSKRINDFMHLKGQTFLSCAYLDFSKNEKKQIEKEIIEKIGNLKEALLEELKTNPVEELETSFPRKNQDILHFRIPSEGPVLTLLKKAIKSLNKQVRPNTYIAPLAVFMSDSLKRIEDRLPSLDNLNEDMALEKDVLPSPKQAAPSQIELDKLVESFCESRSFAQTDEYAKSLSQMGLLDSALRKKLATAFLSNNQVYWKIEETNVARIFHVQKVQEFFPQKD